jgi:hypothetical protein
MSFNLFIWSRGEFNLGTNVEKAFRYAHPQMMDLFVVPTLSFWLLYSLVILEVLKQAAAIVDTKAPSDASAFKSWLRYIAQAVAEASTEGGFLGFGGVPVSEAEKATLAQISTKLGIAA